MEKNFMDTACKWYFFKLLTKNLLHSYGGVRILAGSAAMGEGGVV